MNKKKFSYSFGVAESFFMKRNFMNIKIDIYYRIGILLLSFVTLKLSSLFIFISCLTLFHWMNAAGSLMDVLFSHFKLEFAWWWLSQFVLMKFNEIILSVCGIMFCSDYKHIIFKIDFNFFSVPFFCLTT